MGKSITVAGRIISELSDKIPTYLIALNELIKNAYDAGAREVCVLLNSKEQKLTIIDNGFGMGEKEIDQLLHIATSEKRYGSKNPLTGRYVQGSKGLGFLSVFKFGHHVKWETIRDGRKSSFAIDYNAIIAEEDIKDYIVEVNTESCSPETSGTSIEIILNEESYTGLKTYWDNPINRDKILNSFIDDSFSIAINIDGESFETRRINLQELYKGKQTFRVQYNTNNNAVLFHCMDAKLTKGRTYERKHTRYELNVDIMIFDFTGGRPKKYDDPFFIDSKDRVIPLIFINKNLFSNYDLFDPEVLRYYRGAVALPQMVGYVEIISDDNDIQFNSDRTNFQQNMLTNEIMYELAELNKFIQTEGQKIKSELKDTLPTDTPPATPPTDKPPTPPSVGMPQPTPPTDKPPTPPPVGAPQPTPPLVGTTPKSPLIPNYFGNGYQLNFTCPVAMLLYQINQLDSKRSDYSAVISCALRALFELALYELRKNGKVTFTTRENEFDTRVQNLIDIVANDNAMVTAICNRVSFGFHDLKNLLRAIDFKNVISKAHLAAHKSIEFIGANDIQDIGKAAGLFLTICNEVLNNTNLNWGTKEI